MNYRHCILLLSSFLTITQHAVAAQRCFSSLSVLAGEIQRLDPGTAAEYILCPNTVFSVTDVPVEDYLGSYDNCCSDGLMTPLLLRSDVTIKCGEDGATSNQCVVQGGAVQVISQAAVFNQGVTNNVVVQGVTFESATDTSVVLGNPGDVSFRDCVFQKHTSHNIISMNLSSNYSELGSIISEILGNVNEFGTNDNDVEARQLLTLDGCLIVDNALLDSSPGTREVQNALISVQSALNDLVVHQSTFARNVMDTQGGVAIVVAESSSLDLSRTCFLENDFQGLAPVVVAGDSPLSVQDNSGDTDDGLNCQFLAQVQSLSESSEVLCVDYDREQCIEPTTREPTVSPTSSPMETIDDPTTDDMSPTPSSTNDDSPWQCTLCKPGFVLSRPNVVVEIPEGFGVSIAEAPCGFIESAVEENPQQFTEELCGQLQDLYGPPCGCIEDDGSSQGSVTVDDPTAPDVADACTICEPGQQITRPDAFVEVPEGLVSEFKFFVSCRLMENALEANPGAIDSFLCPRLREGYGPLCGCAEVSPTAAPIPDPASTFLEVSGHRDMRAFGYSHGTLVMAFVLVLPAII